MAFISATTKILKKLKSEAHKNAAQKMRRARIMLEEGVDPKVVWQETGFFRGVDGRLRFEIPEEGTRLQVRARDLPQTPVQAMDIADIPEAAARFHRQTLGESVQPRIAAEDQPGFRGSFSPRENLVRLAPGQGPISEGSTLSHELQHVTQSRQGLPGGSSPESVGIILRRAMDELKTPELFDAHFKFAEFADNAGLMQRLQTIQKFRKLSVADNITRQARQIHGSSLFDREVISREIGAEPKRHRPQHERAAWLNAAADIIARQETNRLSPTDIAAAGRAFKQVDPSGELLLKNADDVLNFMRDNPNAAKNAQARFERQLDKHRAGAREYQNILTRQAELTGLSPSQLYRRTAGEVEARNVQTRALMTPEERAATPPVETEDVARIDQIILESPTLKATLSGAAIAGIGIGESGVEVGGVSAEAGPITRAGKEAAQALSKRRAFHGSPHVFEKFDIEQIGTGEGAQAFGHGLYFSSKREIGEFYRDALSKTEFRRLADDAEVDERMVRQAARDFMRANPGDMTTREFTQLADDGVQRWLRGADTDSPHEKRLRTHLDETFSAKRSGSLLTVEIPDESHMLDWDKPLSEQPQAVQDALRGPDLAPLQAEVAEAERAFKELTTKPDGTTDFEGLLFSNEADTGAAFQRIEDAKSALAQGEARHRLLGDLRERGHDVDSLRGHQLYKFLGGDSMGLRQDPEFASEQLNRLGIQGITYQGVTSGERNFVVFDDATIDIIERGAINPKLLAPIAAVGTGAGFFVNTSQERQQFKQPQPTGIPERSPVDDFQERRAERNQFWEQAKAAAVAPLEAQQFAGEVGLDFVNAMFRPFLTAPATIREGLFSDLTAEELAAERQERDELLDFQPSTPGAQQAPEAAQAILSAAIEPLVRGLGPAAAAVSEPVRALIDKLSPRQKVVGEAVLDVLP